MLDTAQTVVSVHALAHARISLFDSGTATAVLGRADFASQPKENKQRLQNALQLAQTLL